MNIKEFHLKLSKEPNHPLIIKFPILTLSSWFFQGILIMDTTERYFKIFLDFVLFLLLLIILSSMKYPLCILIAFIIAHSLNWIFNGQIFVLLKNLRLIKTDKKIFVEYLEKFKKRVKKEDSILIAASLGSISRGELKETSDIDIRIVRKNGVVNGIRACVFVLSERTRSFLNGFPLDIYVLDDIKELFEFAEEPIIIYKEKEF